MLSANDLRNHTVFEYQGVPYKVVKYQHSHISRRAADIKVKVKDLLKGSIVSFNFSSSDKFEEAQIRKRQMQYLYHDETGYHFMNPKTFEQISFSKQLLGEAANYLKEGQEIEVAFWLRETDEGLKEKAIDINLKNSVVLEVAQTAPGEKGDSVSNMYKPAVMKNGLKVKVPLFIEKGDQVLVDTRTGEYLERAKN